MSPGIHTCCICERNCDCASYSFIGCLGCNYCQQKEPDEESDSWDEGDAEGEGNDGA